MLSKKSVLAICLSLLTSFGASAATNFSGNWFGTCHSNRNEVRNVSLNIYQNGTRGLNIEGRNFNFGQVLETRVPADGTEFPPSYGVAFEVFNLTKNATAMEYLYSGILRQYPSHTWQAIVKTDYSIVNGTLVTTMNDITSGFIENCYYTKY